MHSEAVEYRAGGIVVRYQTGGPEYLLVTSNSCKSRWIVPAGHIETGESAVAAAVREVMEEAGVAAKVLDDMGSIEYLWNRQQQTVRIDTRLFLMEYLHTAVESPEGRQVRFFNIRQLKTLEMWDETRRFLQTIHPRVLARG
ncbi:8-oxo-dGTP pyrophosphatase MutT (NUDIX family) [Hydrogenispora ethanolica]|uniref:8-oxo-dGTP pyrophosphatase MutT (NUDIX family) n=1 Tax=Hydrogenispora ethanolica TaxID=1082276 RepID=A0A4R1RXQ5_HYDET|nr:NUDIX domain-containing protein [Hydrogenispora ethanolica]TCL70960.1 8-oxo-dGTP pyrophosphatase MutT (NUDIX family) [Hydrogenispora ethanolica]